MTRLLSLGFLVLPLVAGAAPKGGFLCRLDGKEWKALIDTAVVTNDKTMGKRLGLSMGTEDASYPRLELTIAWKVLEGKPEGTVTARNAKLSDDLQAFFTPASGTKPYYLEKGTVKVSDMGTTSANFTLDLLFREGNASQAAKNGANLFRIVKCALLEKVPLKI